MSEIELKPCAFCGAKAKHNDGGNSVYGRFWWAVGCSDCDVVFRDREEWHEFDGPMSGRLKFEAKECFDRWNTRAPDPALATKDSTIERLREALEHIDGLFPFEINPSNYSHEQVLEMNSSVDQAVRTARAALEETR